MSIVVSSKDLLFKWIMAIRSACCISLNSTTFWRVIFNRLITRKCYVAMLLLVFSIPSFANRFELIGIEDASIKENVLLHLNDLPENIGKVNLERVTVAVHDKVKKALHADAYFDARIEIIAPDDNPTSAWKIRVSLGEKTKVGRVVLVNDLEGLNKDAIPQEISALINEVKGLEGKPLEQKKYENLRARLRSFSVLYGFFDFSFPLHKLVVQPGENGVSSSATIHWIFYFGKRYRFGDIEFIKEKVGADLVLEVKNFKKGEYFDQSKISQFSVDMQSTKYFASAIARANAENSADGFVPIEVLLTPKDKNLFKYGIGVSSDTGPRLTFDWTRPMVNREGHSFSLNSFFSRPEQNIQADYKVPMGNPLNDFLVYQTGVKRVDNNQTESTSIEFAVQRQYGTPEPDDWELTTFVRLSQERFRQGLDEDTQTTRLLTPGFTYSRYRKKGDLFVDWGDRQQVTISVASEDLFSDINIAKILYQTKWIRQYGKHRFIARGDIGALATNDFDSVPSSERFFAGGDQSIRAFGLDEIADFREVEVVDENGDLQTEIELLGGRYLTVGSAEYAYQFKPSWRAAVFLDAGSASREFGEDIAWGAGLGVHWLSPFGTVRVYFATGESEIERSNRIHITIGPGI